MFFNTCYSLQTMMWCNSMLQLIKYGLSVIQSKLSSLSVTLSMRTLTCGFMGRTNIYNLFNAATISKNSTCSCLTHGSLTCFGYGPRKPIFTRTKPSIDYYIRCNKHMKKKGKDQWFFFKSISQGGILHLQGLGLIPGLRLCAWRVHQ